MGWDSRPSPVTGPDKGLGLDGSALAVGATLAIASGKSVWLCSPNPNGSLLCSATGCASADSALHPARLSGSVLSRTCACGCGAGFLAGFSTGFSAFLGFFVGCCNHYTMSIAKNDFPGSRTIQNIEKLALHLIYFHLVSPCIEGSGLLPALFWGNLQS